MGATFCFFLQRARSYRIDTLGIAVGIGLLFYGASQGQMDWQKLPPLPDPHGFAGAFVGLIEDELIVLGGANFPTAPPWEGGIKQWSRKRYRLANRDASWVSLDDYREELGYGVSITTVEGMVCIGGSNAQRHRDAVFLLRRDRSSDRTTLEEIQLPSLPKSLANMCGVEAGGYLYVMGGSETPDATQSSSAFLRLRWDRKTLEAFATTNGSTDWGWESLPSWPGAPRMLATAAVIHDSVLLAGGVALSADAKGKPVRHICRTLLFIHRNGVGSRFPTCRRPSQHPLRRLGCSKEFCASWEGTPVRVLLSLLRTITRALLAWRMSLTSRIVSGALGKNLPSPLSRRQPFGGKGPTSSQQEKFAPVFERPMFGPLGKDPIRIRKRPRTRKSFDFKNGIVEGIRWTLRRAPGERTFRNHCRILA